MSGCCYCCCGQLLRRAKLTFRQTIFFFFFIFSLFKQLPHNGSKRKVREQEKECKEEEQVSLWGHI
jgi:hypothetical protein